MTTSNVNANSAAIKLSDMQRLMLSAAAQREDGYVTRPG